MKLLFLLFFPVWLMAQTLTLSVAKTSFKNDQTVQYQLIGEYNSWIAGISVNKGYLIHWPVGYEYVDKFSYLGGYTLNITRFCQFEPTLKLTISNTASDNEYTRLGFNTTFKFNLNPHAGLMVSNDLEWFEFYPRQEKLIWKSNPMYVGIYIKI